MLVSYTTIPRTVWAIATFSPYSEVVNHLGMVTGYMLAVLVVGLVGLLIVLRYVIKRNTRPLEDPTKVACHKDSPRRFSARLPRDTP